MLTGRERSGDPEFHRFRRRIEAAWLRLLDLHADLRDLLEPLKKGARDIDGHPFKEHTRASGDFTAHAGGDLGDIDAGREFVTGDRGGEIQRERHVDQVVVRLLLLGGRGSLATAAAQAADEDATGQRAHDPASRGAPGLSRGIQVAP